MSDMSMKNTDGSTGIQVNGNLSIGIPPSEIAKIIQNLYDLNFPRLVEEASRKAFENVKKFQEEFINEVRNDLDQIQEKLKDPNGQFILNESIQQAARLGDKANLKLLSKALKNALLVEDTNDFSSIVSLAISLIPQLSKEELLAILVSFLIHTLSFRFNELRFIDMTMQLCLNNYTELGNVSQTQLFHMVSLGLYSFNAFAGDKCIDLFDRKYPNIQNLKAQIASGSFKSIQFLIEYYDNNGLVHFHPLPVANMIGFLLVRENMPALDINMLING